MNLEIEYKSLSDLIPYARNSRTHSEAQVKRLAASIREFGFVNPILISSGNDIVAGHGRALAAEKLGLDLVPTITLGHLSDTQRRAYVIADNRLAENAGWDSQMLAIEIDELAGCGFDMDLLGFENFRELEAEIVDNRKLENVIEGDTEEDEAGEFEPDLPDENAEKKIEAKLVLTVTCESDDQLEELFQELNERGFKVRV